MSLLIRLRVNPVAVDHSDLNGQVIEPGPFEMGRYAGQIDLPSQPIIDPVRTLVVSARSACAASASATGP